MKLSVCFILLIVEELVTCSTLKTWFNPCSNNGDCLHLQNATCKNSYCNCGDQFYVCEQKPTNLGKKCNGDSVSCNNEFLECGPESICVCKEGYFASSDSQRCMQVLGTNCTSSDACNQLGQQSSFVCNGGQCRCKSNYREESGFCKRNHATSVSSNVFFIVAATLSFILLK